ncbi:hypothetical protein FRB97_000769 [Tulasnella sp. 331]|nr:hypothetical protein FRB97_000769 [Tulasnella sp. 331]KAG8886940.1 hypothetical protein FRB98_000768 [Tulasnella sp. 332]
MLPFLTLAAPVSHGASHLTKRVEPLADAIAEAENVAYKKNRLVDASMKDPEQAYRHLVDHGMKDQPATYSPSLSRNLATAEQEKIAMEKWLKENDRLDSDSPYDEDKVLTPPPKKKVTKKLMELGAIQESDRWWDQRIAGELKQENALKAEGANRLSKSAQVTSPNARVKDELRPLAHSAG